MFYYISFFRIDKENGIPIILFITNNTNAQITDNMRSDMMHQGEMIGRGPGMGMGMMDHGMGMVMMSPGMVL
jgi:hypothetical protein